MPILEINKYVEIVEEGSRGEDLEVTEFIPTRFELLQLVKYWARTKAQREFGCFFATCHSASDARVVENCYHRINEIAKWIGNLAAEQASEEAWAEFGENQDPEHWRVFMYGSEAEIKSLLERFREDDDPRKPLS